MNKSQQNTQDTNSLNTEELDLLLVLIPQRIRDEIAKFNPLDLIEIVMDLGRRPELRFTGQPPLKLTEPVTQEELSFIIKNVGSFTSENRAGIETTLHRISAIRNPQGIIIGLTCRVGRILTGTIELEKEFLTADKSSLILGPPGSGKTSKLREIAYLYSEIYEKRTIIVDTSMEIAGSGDIPHPSIGRARRMPVIDHHKQHEVMIEAVENHTPEVIIIDEISTEAEALAAQTIAERGVILIATAHGRDLESIVKNPSLCKLIGDPQSVTLSDEEARKRNVQKNILLRSGPSYFQNVIEIISYHSILIHTDVEYSVDNILNGVSPVSALIKHNKQLRNISNAHNELVIYPYAISRDLVRQALQALNLEAVITDDINHANIMIVLEDYNKPESSIYKQALENNLITKTVQSSELELIKDSLKLIEIELITQQNINDNTTNTSKQDELELRIALEEVELAIQEYKMNKHKTKISLFPRKAIIRQAQKELLIRHNIVFHERGKGDNKHIVINS